MRVEIDPSDDVEKGRIVSQAASAIYGAGYSLRNFPGLLKQIIWAKAWERRVSKGRVIELDSLRELITEKPFRGWGEDPKKVEAVIRDDPECLTMFREAMKCQGKRTDLLGCESQLSDKGTGNRSYTLSRLERDAPELFEAVCSGEMSANAAAIKAGFRKQYTHAEKCVREFRKAENRIEALRLIWAELEEFERIVMLEHIQVNHD